MNLRKSIIFSWFRSENGEGRGGGGFRRLKREANISAGKVITSDEFSSTDVALSLPIDPSFLPSFFLYLSFLSDAL